MEIDGEDAEVAPPCSRQREDLSPKYAKRLNRYLMRMENFSGPTYSLSAAALVKSDKFLSSHH
jgi:hypothetical protein